MRPPGSADASSGSADGPPRSGAGAAPVAQLVEHLFRSSAGRMVASLTRAFGPPHLQLAEDVVQEALVRALRSWSFHGPPPEPEAWLMRTARNLALDVLRREVSFRTRQPEIRATLAAWAESSRAAAQGGTDAFEDTVRDDQLRMMFCCCHPVLQREAQVALTLKTLCGFGVEEIARAFLARPASIAQRLVRARRRLREAQVDFGMPEAAALPARLDAVLDTLYLMFNEGYAAHRGAELVRHDLVDEALRVGRLLAGHVATGVPRTQALLALMLLQAARTGARTAPDGEMLLLAEQDRTRWDRKLVAEGLHCLNESARGEELTAFHVQAAIAACHSGAPSWERTNWPLILEQYDLLMRLAPSPVVALNRAVALGMVQGPEAALSVLAELDAEEALARYALRPAVRGEMLLRLGRRAEAALALREALALGCSEPERRLLERKLAACV